VVVLARTEKNVVGPPVARGVHDSQHSALGPGPALASRERRTAPPGSTRAPASRSTLGTEIPRGHRVRIPPAAPRCPAQAAARSGRPATRGQGWARRTLD
jgi:hypothetical protein